MSEQVNHPGHYNVAGRKECIVEMEEKFGKQAVIDFCRCNEFKYLYRAGSKEGNSYEQDRQKAQWYHDYEEKLSKKKDCRNCKHFNPLLPVCRAWECKYEQ